MHVIYKLTLTGEVTTITKVINLNDREILFSDGWHPYYCLNNSVDDLTIELNAEEKLELSQNNIPNGAVYNLNNGSCHNIDLRNKNLNFILSALKQSDIEYIK